ncbi:single-stranded-DNA-specific exonuclease RecJ [Candidatus Poribacteria bacterium]|nr:single-stranded-DNA-specific exonuclease RecJ [Candidatus Poribacteria bacterium]
MIRKTWKSKEFDSATSFRLASQLGVSQLMGKLLVSRGIEAPEVAQSYLYPTQNDLHSPSLLPGMSDAVDRIKLAINANEKIWIFGDYDVDGTTAASLLINTFHYLGCSVECHIPDRFVEGYGLNKEAIQSIANAGCNLLITVDCGITSIPEVAFGNSLGIDTIITDHHLPSPKGLPPAYTIINPKLEGSQYPFDSLAGIGLAFKLAHGLMDGNLNPFLVSQLDLVALGTVVDMVPLVNENRALSKLGLEVINKRQRLGIRALCEVADIASNTKITGQTLGFTLGPRLNAAGRMDHAKTVIKLLTTDLEEEALQLANELNELNHDRREIQAKIEREAISQIEQKDLSQVSGLVVAKRGWHRGITGIVASNIKDRYHRPVFFIAIEDGEGHASGRGIDGINLAESLDACSDLLIKHGGHKAAAGFSIKTENIPLFEDHFNQYARERLSPDDLAPKLHYDFEVHIPNLTLETIKELSDLEPRGAGNDAPMLIMKNLRPHGEPRIIGHEKKHLKFVVTDGHYTIEAIAFNMADHKTAISNKNSLMNLAFSPEINEWQGRTSPQLMIKDIQIRSVDRSSNRRVYPPLNVESPARIIDQRGVDDKPKYISQILAQDEPTLIYVRNDKAIDQLLGLIQSSGKQLVGKCEAETPNDKKQILAEMLAEDKIRAIISAATINFLPKVQHVIICHPFSIPDLFFERCKSAFNHEYTTDLHLIYHDRDFEFERRLLMQQYPDRETLGVVYQNLRVLTKHKEPVELEMFICSTVQSKSISEDTILNALTVLAELKLVTNHMNSNKIEVLSSKKCQLNASKIYQYGEEIKMMSEDFTGILRKNSEDIWERINYEFGKLNSID